MSYVLSESFNMNLGTTRRPKFEVYDEAGDETFEISTCTWTLKNHSTGALLSSGSATVNNADNDIAGNTIKTVRPSIDLTLTDATTGFYVLSLFVSFTNGESEVFRVTIECDDVREV